MRITLTLFFLSLTLGLFAQVKPNEFTEETDPENSNFEVYSQKGGVNRRASLYNLKRYFTAAIEPSAIGYVPAASGNPSSEYGKFVVDPNGDRWYIDMTGASFLIYSESEALGVEDAFLSTNQDTLFIVTQSDTVIVPGLTDVNTDEQGFTLDSDASSVTLDLSGTADDVVLKEGSNITLSVTGDTISISSSGGTGSGGETNEGLNLGGGAEVFKQKADTTFEFRTLVDAGIVTVTEEGDTIIISATEVDGSITNEIQTITISNDTVYLSSGGFVVLPGSSDDQAISISNDTITLEDGGFVVVPPTDFGTGTDGRIAYWQDDKLTSTIWEITSNHIRGSSTGWPHIENGLLSYRGDTDTGIKRFFDNNVGIIAGDASNPIIQMNGSVVNFDFDHDGSIDWQMYSSGIIPLDNYYPRLGFQLLSFSGDTDVGLKWFGSDDIGLLAGDNNNAIIRIDGADEEVRIDPDDDGTPEGTWHADELELDATLKINTWYTSPDAVALFGVNTSQGNNLVYMGEGVKLENDTLSISDALGTSLFCGGDNIATSQTISLSGTSSYDTIGWTTTFQDETGITYGAPNPGQDSSIIFTYGGRYEITISFTAEFAAGASNKFVFLKLNKNGTTGVTGGSHTFGFEDTNNHACAVTLQADVDDGDYLQILMRSNHGSNSDITFRTPKISIKPMR